MKLPLITQPIHLVIGETTVEVGQLVVEHKPGHDDQVRRGVSDGTVVVPICGRVEFGADFARFVEQHRSAQDTAESPTARPRRTPRVERSEPGTDPEPPVREG